MSDALIYFGEAVKALDDTGRVGGYLVRFTDAKAKDLDGDYFTAQTYLGARNGDGVDTLFHHGRPLEVKGTVSAAVKSQVAGFADHIFAPVKTKKDAVGIWAETVLDLADAYEKAVFGLVKANKLGWSSGALSHTVKRESDGELKRWIIGEASLTPTPASPTNRAIEVKSLDAVHLIIPEIEEESEPDDATKKTAIAIADAQKKSLGAYLSQLIEDRIDDGYSRNRMVAAMAREAGCDTKTVDAVLADTEHPNAAQLKAFTRVIGVDPAIFAEHLHAQQPESIKGIFETTLQEQGFSNWRLWDIFCGVVTKIATVSKNAAAMGMKFDMGAKLDEAYDEFVTRHKKLVVSQINDYIEANVDERFYLKAIIEPIIDAQVTCGVDLDDHSQLAVSAFKGVAARFRVNHEARKAEKAGRVLSDKNRNRIMNLMKQMKSVMDDMQKLLDESMPMASDAQKRAAQSEFLRLKARTQQLGVGNNG